MRRSRFDPARQRQDQSFERQSGTRTVRDIFVSSCETYRRNGWRLGGDLVQLNRILEIKTDCRYLGGYAPVTETPPKPPISARNAFLISLQRPLATVRPCTCLPLLRL